MKLVSGIKEKDFSAMDVNDGFKFGSVFKVDCRLEVALDEADRVAEEDNRRYSNEEVFTNLRMRINGR